MTFIAINSYSHLVDDLDGANLTIGMTADTIDQRFGRYTDSRVENLNVLFRIEPPLDGGPALIHLYTSPFDSWFRSRRMTDRGVNSDIVRRVIDALSVYVHLRSPNHAWLFTSDFAELQKGTVTPLFELPEGMRTI